jgi:hypothetical protein
VKFAIYPPLGIGRIGNSPEFNLSPEKTGSHGIQLNSDGSEVEAQSWKDAQFQVKRLAPRFELFEIPSDGTEPKPAQLPPGTTVTWTVRLANKKDAVQRPVEPPPQPIAIQVVAGRETRVVDTGVQTIVDASAAAVPMSGTYQGSVVSLGEIRTDSKQRLIVLGGHGKSASLINAPVGPDFYNNPDWHDDVSDGPVTATVVIPGQAPIQALASWVVFAPPDFAPAATAVVTLYDVVTQVAIDQGWMPAPTPVSFNLHIRPMIERASSLQWVDSRPNWAKVSTDWANLADVSVAQMPLRAGTASRVKAVETLLHSFKMRDWQKAALNEWVAGNFDPAPRTLSVSSERVRASLDASVGQGFFPGIEAGTIVQAPGNYSQPFDFRIDHTKRAAGDLTALMALPWQADFLKCAGGWWPSQRPGIAPQPDGSQLEWSRPYVDQDDHKDLVDHCMQLGMIVLSGGRGFETGRDPAI